jgi:hypothetical protein
MIQSYPTNQHILINLYVYISFVSYITNNGIGISTL